MRFFVLYGLARLASFLVVFGLLWLIVGSQVQTTATNLLFVAVLALAISAVFALFFLRSLRDKAAVELAERAGRMKDSFDQARTKEDVD